MCFSIDQCIASGIHIFTFANSSRNIPLNISFFIHFLYTFCVPFKAKATAGFDIRGLKCPEFLAMADRARESEKRETFSPGKEAEKDGGGERGSDQGRI